MFIFQSMTFLMLMSMCKTQGSFRERERETTTRNNTQQHNAEEENMKGGEEQTGLREKKFPESNSKLGSAGIILDLFHRSEVPLKKVTPQIRKRATKRPRVSFRSD